MLKSIGLTVIATLLGQALGFIVDILIAGSFGTSWKADAYFLAFMICFIISDFLSGAVNALFIPFYSGRSKDSQGDSFFSSFANVLAAITVILGAALFAFAPWLISLIAPRFAPEASALTVSLTRILTALVVITPVSMLLSLRLNAHGRFFLPALGKSFSFAFIIASLIFLRDSIDIYSLPAGHIFGGVFFIIILFFLLRSSGLGYRVNYGMGDPALREMGVLLLTLLFTGIANYINILIDRSIASGFDEGSIASLNYGFKLVNIPVNLFVLGGLTVLLPALSKSIAEEGVERLREMALKGLGFVSFFIIPVAVMMAILRVPAVKLLFERGAFTAQSTEATSLAVFFYCFGVPALAAVAVMSRVFYAMKSLKMLSFVGVCIIAFNIVTVITLSRRFGFIGIPLTFSVTTTVNMIVLLAILEKRVGDVALPFIKRLAGHLAAAGVMGWALVAASGLIAGYFPLHSKTGSTFYIAAMSCIGAGVYVSVASLMRVKEVSIFSELAKRARERLGAG